MDLFRPTLECYKKKKAEQDVHCWAAKITIQETQTRVEAKAARSSICQESKVAKKGPLENVVFEM